MKADIWTSSTDQKLQLLEQILVLFNPSLEIQTTDNYIDWTSLSVLTLESQTWSSRSIPQGVEQDIDILNMTFSAPIWITPPAKVKKLGIITKIITNIFAVPQGTVQADLSNPYAADVFAVPDSTVTVTPGNYELLVMNNVASLIKTSAQGDSLDVSNPDNVSSWMRLLDLYPGQFRAGLSQIRLTKPDGNEIVSYISLDPLDESRMMLNIDGDTIPTNTVIAGRGTVDAIIDPTTFNPLNKVTGTRYLILENINSTYANGPVAWLNSNGEGVNANANDIIEWSGEAWEIVFNSNQATGVTYITNAYTGIQYKWDLTSWSKSFDGIYNNGAWRLIL
jgi:hypothetical protein